MKPEELFNEVNEMWTQVHNDIHDLELLTPFEMKIPTNKDYDGLIVPLEFRIQKYKGKWTIFVKSLSGFTPIMELRFNLRCQLLEFAPDIIKEIIIQNNRFFEQMKKDIKLAVKFYGDYQASMHEMAQDE